MWDENVQVNGVSVFVDMTGLTMAHHTHIMNLENAKKMVNFYQVTSQGYLRNEFDFWKVHGIMNTSCFGSLQS